MLNLTIKKKKKTKTFLQCGHGLRESSAFPRSWMALLSSSSFFLSLGLTTLFSIALTTVITGTECPLAQDSGKEPKNFLTSHSPGRDSCLSHKRTLKRKRKAGEEMVNCTQTIVVVAVTKSCPTLCDPMDCSTPGFPFLPYLPESQTIQDVN